MYREDGEVAHRPAYLDICAETIHRHAGWCEVRVLDGRSAPGWLPDTPVDPRRRLPSPVHRSDHARTRLGTPS